MVTMHDVAAAAGVSAKTVSRVFNGDPHVAPETRTRVEAVLREQGYVPNAVATTFRAGRAPIIGLVVPDLVDPFFGSIANAVGAVAAEHGMAVSVTNIGTDPDRERSVVTSVLSQALSGLVLAPVTEEQRYLDAWANRVPIVFVDRTPAKFHADSFTQDDRGGAALATTHLLALGHRRIAFVGDALTATTKARLEGYQHALTDADHAVDPELMALDVWDRQAAAGAVHRLTHLADPPTAVFSSNVRSSMALIPALRGRDDLGLLSFGDFPMADQLRTPVTVIDQDPEQLGHLAAERVLERIERPERRYRRRTVIPVTLVQRDSCSVGAPHAQ